MKKTRKFRGGIDPLEPRTVPSSGHPAAQVLSIHGSGQLTTGTETTVPGGIQAKVGLSGTFSGLSQTTGTLDTVVQTRSLRFNATAILNAADGDQLDISFSGSNQKARPQETRAVGQFHFNVYGGTGAFAGATGSGTITVIETLATGADTFKINGKVRE